MWFDFSLSRLKRVALNILNTLTKQDFVNVVVSRSEFWSSRGRYHDHTPQILSCDAKRLVPASTAHHKELAAQIEALKPQGGSNHM